MRSLTKTKVTGSDKRTVAESLTSRWLFFIEDFKLHFGGCVTEFAANNNRNTEHASAADHTLRNAFDAVQTRTHKLTR